MKEILSEISQNAIELSESDFNEVQINTKWIGHDPATNQQIQELEARLGLVLPEDFKAFLRLTNGFDAACVIEPSFCNIEKIDLLVNVDSELVEIWTSTGNNEEKNRFKSAIKVGGFDEEQYFFLIPPNISNKNWEYWKFATWIPGEEIYPTLQSYFSNVLEVTEMFLEK